MSKVLFICLSERLFTCPSIKTTDWLGSLSKPSKALEDRTTSWVVPVKSFNGTKESLFDARLSFRQFAHTKEEISTEESAPIQQVRRIHLHCLLSAGYNGVF